MTLRYPQGAPIKSVTVNGQNWSGFDKPRELIHIEELVGTVAVTAKYSELAPAWRACQYA